MATDAGDTRRGEDRRCELCRQKNAFHCEHDTPNRDQMLDAQGPEKAPAHNPRTSVNNNPTGRQSTQNVASTRYASSNDNGRSQSDRLTIDYPSSNPTDRKKKSKGEKTKSKCVIS